VTTDYPLPATNRIELIERIRDARASLETLLSPLTSDQVLVPLGDWSIRDHLAHLAAWTGKALALLNNRPAHEGLGLPSPPADPRDYDAINTLLRARDESLTLEDVIVRWGSRDGEILAMLMLASDRDLRRPTPAGEPDGRTVLAAVANNTYEHAIEHEAWIREGLAKLGW
jgi:hypothetical protein